MNTAKKFWYTVLSGGVTYSAEAQAVFDRMTDLTTDQKNALATFIDSQVALSQFDNIIECWCWGGLSQANSLIGWKGVRDCDVVNSPTYAQDTGWNLNGTNQYISSNFIPSTDAVGFDAKLSCGAFIKENLSTANADSLLGTTAAAGVGRLEITQTPSSAVINTYANSATAFGVSEGATDDKIFDSETEYTIVQLSGTASFYKDGLLISSAARANNGLSTLEIVFGAANVNGVITQHLNSRLVFGYVIDPTGFDYRAFHLALKTMLISLGVYSSTPELTIPTGGEWFDFSQASVGNFSSLLGKKSALTCLGVNTPTIEEVSGVKMLKTESSGSKVVDLASVFQALYDGTLPAMFSILVTIKPIDGTPSSAQAILGHTNGNNQMYARIGTDGKITLGFKEAVQAAVNTITTYAAFDDSPSNVTILIFEFIKDNMITEVNGTLVLQTEDSWGTRALTDFDGGAINMYLGCENVDGTPTRVFDGYIGDFMIRKGAWSQSQKERLINYFA